MSGWEVVSTGESGFSVEDAHCAPARVQTRGGSFAAGSLGPLGWLQTQRWQGGAVREGHGDPHTPPFLSRASLKSPCVIC